MFRKVYCSAKATFNYEYANLATVIFFLFLLISFLVQPGQFQTLNSKFTPVALLIFVNTIHVIFQYWMIQSSDTFNSVVAKNIKVQAIFKKMLLISLFVFLFLLFLKATGASVVWQQIVIVGLASQHAFGQTYGLYCANRLNGVRPHVSLKDVRALRYYVYFAICGQLFLIFVKHYKVFTPSEVAFLCRGFMLLTFAWIASIAVFVIRQSPKKWRLGWIFARFFIAGFSFINPLAIFAISSIHGAEYFDVVQKVRARSEFRFPDFKFLFFFVSAIGILAIFELYHYFNRSDDGFISTIVVSFSLALTLVHYLFDYYAYRMKSAETRGILIELLH